MNQLRVLEGALHFRFRAAHRRRSQSISSHRYSICYQIAQLHRSSTEIEPRVSGPVTSPLGVRLHSQDATAIALAMESAIATAHVQPIQAPNMMTISEMQTDPEATATHLDADVLNNAV